MKKEFWRLKWWEFKLRIKGLKPSPKEKSSLISFLIDLFDFCLFL
ncbi:hypothetical protein MCSF7_01451 [Mycoplasmopsis columbina SF7]|uniref:Uncharacterized protein n=1 Tax=Mycoplasmopsis columbina SF7 TaxID=1037410 RepID=F9UK79_9BACT|nr:hypothetical protein [Mycoplasmopsis columbina]EGV00084.1 hypothetical protein MCSF7_01451 [Mycoplasmopsis columbina SF7]